MTYFPVVSPLEIFCDLNGEPLEDGYIYIGEAYQNPITNPVTVTWDSIGLYPAAQPIRTIAGYPDRNGSPGKIFVNAGAYEDYSILIKDKNGVTNFFSQSSRFDTIARGNSVDLISDLRAINGYGQPIYVRGHTTIGDGGEGTFEWFDGVSIGTYIDNNGTIIVPTGGDGSGAWLRQYDGIANVKWFGAIGDGLTTKTDNSIAIQAALDSEAFNIHIPVTNGEVYYLDSGLTISRSYVTLFSDFVGSLSTDDPVLLVKEGVTAIWVQASNVSVRNISIKYDVDITGYTFPDDGSRGIVVRHPDSFGPTIGDWTFVSKVYLRECCVTNAYMSIQFEFVFWCQAVNCHTVWNMYGFVLNKDQWDEFGTGASSGTTVYFGRCYDHGNNGGGKYGTPVGSTGFWVGFCHGTHLHNCTTNGADYGIYANRATNLEIVQFYMERTNYPVRLLSCFGRTVIDSPYFHTLYGTPAIYCTYTKLYLNGGAIKFDATALPGGGEVFEGTLGGDLDVITPPVVTNGTDLVSTLSAETEVTLQLKSTKDGSWAGTENLGSIEFYGSDTGGTGPGVKASIRGRQNTLAGTRCALLFSTGDGVTDDKEQLLLETNGDLFPLTGAAQDLGTSTYHWDNLYCQNVVSTIGTAKIWGTGGGIVLGGNITYPANPSGFTSNNTNDLGAAAVQWKDIYLVNAPTVSSDRNLKTDITEINEAEKRVALKAKALMRRYRIKSSIESKGDTARYHFGIIAQDLQQAFFEEKLDASRYGMFIKNTWYEAMVTEVVKLDVDHKEIKQTYLKQYDTKEKAPPNAIERTILGIRYDELLAFIIAAL